MVNYYRRFIPNIAQTLTPVDNVLKGKAKKLEWSSPQQHAFTRTKNAVTNATTLAHFDDNAPLRLTTDARKRRLWGCAGTARRCYVPGKKNPVADALSRIEIDAIHLGIDYANLSSEQRTDLEAQDHLTGPYALKITAIPLGPAGVTILYDNSTGRPCPWIPASCRRKIFDIIHGLSHPSGPTTTRLLSENFIWPGIKKDAQEWVKTCINCQTSIISHHTESGIGVPDGELHRRGLEIMTSLGTSHLRTAPRSDGKPSPADKVYGEALAVPGEFFPTSTDDTQLDHLRDIARKFWPCLKTYQDRTMQFKPRNLDECGYVFVRVDAHRQPLTRPFRGPYRVIKKTTKPFLLEVHGQEDWVSINRVKPAFLEGSDTASAGPGRSRVPPQNKATYEKKSNKR
ncbi:uncharacterized protein [Palaemon carinicauda]|uniref:uncharacterized protein n=1 Tax=Palaemon carinicauda TaxID=392227 RepID=UPI0035B5A240